MTDKRMTNGEAKQAVLNLITGHKYFFSGEHFASDLAEGFVGEVTHVYDDGSADIECVVDQRDQSLVWESVQDGMQTWSQVDDAMIMTDRMFATWTKIESRLSEILGVELYFTGEGQTTREFVNNWLFYGEHYAYTTSLEKLAACFRQAGDVRAARWMFNDLVINQ